MSGMIYGTFEHRAVANRLAASLNHRDRMTTHAIAHPRHLAEESVAICGTLALPFGLVGACVVGFAVACMSWMVMWPMLDLRLPWTAFVCFAIVAAPFGALAGVLAGSAELRPRLASLAARAETADRTVVTAAIPENAMRRTFASFVAAGGREVGIA